MAYLVIGCDLNGSAADPVQGALESWGAVRLLDSLWLLETPLGAGYVRSALEDVVDGGDRVAVFAIQPGSEWSASSEDSPGSKWLQSKIGVN
ncbi:hypothetical protein GCM10023264_24910 [Sphingomonas daechungensis]|uniref:hypothetical protein n=1 Tax=Sphingomonas daechungensis TaxID=1176646 RepID=UPI0031F18BE0